MLIVQRSETGPMADLIKNTYKIWFHKVENGFEGEWDRVIVYFSTPLTTKDSFELIPPLWTPPLQYTGYMHIQSQHPYMKVVKCQFPQPENFTKMILRVFWQFIAESMRVCSPCTIEGYGYTIFWDKDALCSIDKVREAGLLSNIQELSHKFTDREIRIAAASALPKDVLNTIISTHEIPMTNNPSLFITPVQAPIMPTTTPTPSMFGAPSATTTTHTPGMFGAPSATTTPTPGMFGAPSATTTPTPGMFGAPSATTPTPGMFGAPSATTTPTPGMFGAPSAPTPGMFGAPSAPTPGMFGAPSAPTPSMFGAPSATTFGNTPGMFGASSATTFGKSQPSTPGMFGASSATTFGKSQPSTPGMFGSPSATTFSGVFNTNKTTSSNKSSSNVFEMM